MSGSLDRITAVEGLIERVRDASMANFALECQIDFVFDGARTPPPNCTASLDAACVLAERVLPDWSLRLDLSEGYRHPCVVMSRSHPTNMRVAVEHRTAPLAIVLATLTAHLAILKQKEAGDGH